jgi:hypothetical protein
MLRSLGIPARVAAGFFIDPESAVFDYHVVRSNMAHAWVEVPFPGFGWLEFDPTSENLAEGEEFNFSAGIDPKLLEKLMREILENRSRLRVKMVQDGKGGLTGGRSPAEITVLFLKNFLLPLLALALLVAYAVTRCGYLWLSYARRNPRKKAVSLWKHARRRMRLAGMPCPLSIPESLWALEQDEKVKGLYSMYLAAAAARFAPEYGNEDLASIKNCYSLFADSYRLTIPFGRRLLAWILPPAALIYRSKSIVN